MNENAVVIDKDLDQETRRLLQAMKRADYENTFIDREDFDGQVRLWASNLKKYKGMLLDGFARALEMVQDRALRLTDILRGCEEAQRRKEAEIQSAMLEGVNLEELPSYVKANRDLSEEEQKRNMAPYYDKLRAFAQCMVKEGRISPDHLKRLPPIDFSSVQQTEELPFTPDASELEEDSEE